MSGPEACFFFDLASPEAYLAAEQVLQVLPGPAEWQPVLAGELAGAANGDEAEPRERADLRERAHRPPHERLSERAESLGLQALRLPEQFPFDSSLAMRVATYAKSIGRTVPFAQAAFRQAFAGARSLAEPDNVLIAAAACEMHPAAVLRGAELRSVRARLRESTDRAVALGVERVPAVWVATPGSAAGGLVFHGEDRLAEAAAEMRARSEAAARPHTRSEAAEAQLRAR